MSPVIGVKVRFNRNRSGSVSNLLAMNKVSKDKYKFRSIPSLNLNSNSSSARRNQVVAAAAAERVTFVVGHQGHQHKFKVHPSILTSSSDVFKMMLESPQWSTSSTGEAIEIVDVKPEAFRVLLLSLTYGLSRIQQLLTMPLALDTYYAAHKYNLVALEEFLSKYVQRNANPENILELLNYAEFYGLRVVEGYCWSVIEKQTLQVVRSNGFAYAKWDHLCGILENSRLTIGEFDLFHGVLRWCAVESRRPENNGKHIYNIIGVAVYKIRFPLMTPMEFEFVIKSGILKAGEIVDLRANFRKNTTYCHQIRRHDCNCRRYRLPCELCTTDHFPIIPVDGRGRNLKVAKKIFQPVVPNSLLAFAANSGKKNGMHNNYYNLLNEQEGKCECLKYASCPAYPNGVSAAIMLELNL